MATKIQLPEDFKEFLRLLKENEVEYLLVGGYAEKNVAEIDVVEVNLISLSNLKINKKASGRLKDLNDLENLP